MVKIGQTDKDGYTLIFEGANAELFLIKYTFEIYAGKKGERVFSTENLDNAIDVLQKYDKHRLSENQIENIRKLVDSKIQRRKNKYTHQIELKKLRIRNAPREEFRNLLEKVEYRGYEVEQLEDGRKIVITKPGGKFVYGRVKKEDFVVWVYNPLDSTLWAISHKDIYKDLQEKGDLNAGETIRIIDALEKVYNGEEPEEVLKNTKLSNPSGENPEVLLKAYKWIWGQEDCNYPDGKGREMSMYGTPKIPGLRELRETLNCQMAT